MKRPSSCPGAAELQRAAAGRILRQHPRRSLFFRRLAAQKRLRGRLCVGVFQLDAVERLAGRKAGSVEAEPVAFIECFELFMDLLFAADSCRLRRNHRRQKPDNCQRQNQQNQILILETDCATSRYDCQPAVIPADVSL